MSVTEWLRAKFNGTSDDVASSSNTELSDLARNSEQILWLRVNDFVAGKRKHFADPPAENLAEQTIRMACEKTQSAQLARYLAEAELERVKDQSGATIRQLTEQLDRVAFRLAAAEQETAAAEQRETAAIQRAHEAEAALRRLQAHILAGGIMKKLTPRAA